QRAARIGLAGVGLIELVYQADKIRSPQLPIECPALRSRKQVRRLAIAVEIVRDRRANSRGTEIREVQAQLETRGQRGDSGDVENMRGIEGGGDSRPILAVRPRPRCLYLKTPGKPFARKYQQALVKVHR